MYFTHYLACTQLIRAVESGAWGAVFGADGRTSDGDQVGELEVGLSRDSITGHSQTAAWERAFATF